MTTTELNDWTIPPSIKDGLTPDQLNNIQNWDMEWLREQHEFNKKYPDFHLFKMEILLSLNPNLKQYQVNEILNKERINLGLQPLEIPKKQNILIRIKNYFFPNI